MTVWSPSAMRCSSSPSRASSASRSPQPPSTYARSERSRLRGGRWGGGAPPPCPWRGPMRWRPTRHHDGTFDAMRRSAQILLLTSALLALNATAALAHDGGEGWWGETNDKVVTNAGFILIAFFPLFIFVMSVIQWRLEKRKDARKAAAKARIARADVRGGW